MLARRKRVRERGTWSVLKLDSRPERVLEQGSPTVRCITNHTVSIEQLTVFRWFVSKTQSIGPPGRLTLGAGIQGRHSQTRLPPANFLQPSGSIPTPKPLHSTENSEEPRLEVYQVMSERRHGSSSRAFACAFPVMATPCPCGPAQCIHQSDASTCLKAHGPSPDSPRLGSWILSDRC